MNELGKIRLPSDYETDKKIVPTQFYDDLKKSFPNFQITNNTITTTTTNNSNNTVINIVTNNYMSKSGRNCTPRKKSLPYPKLTPYKIPNFKVYYYQQYQ